MEVVHQGLEDEDRHVMEPEGEEDDYGDEDIGDEDNGEREAEGGEMGDDLQEEEEVEGLDLYDDVDLGYGMTPPVLEPIPGQIRSQPARETEAVEDEQERQMTEADDEPVEGLGLDLYEDVDLGEDYGIPPQVPVPVAARTESGAKASNGRLANDADGTVHRAEPMSDTHKAASRASGQEISPSHVAQASKHGRGDSGAGGGTIGGPGVQIVGSGTTAGALVVDSKIVANEYLSRHGLGGSATTSAPASMNGESTTLVVGELHWWTTDAQLETALSEYGRVKGVTFFEEKASGKSKGYCQVEFYEASAAHKCKEHMNGRVFNGRGCVIHYATPSVIKQQQIKQQQKEASMNAAMQGRGSRPLIGGGEVSGPARTMVRGPMVGRSGPMMGGPAVARVPVGMASRVRVPGRGPGMGGPFGEGMTMGSMGPRMMGPGYETGYEPSYEPSFEGYGPMGPGYGVVPGMGMQGGRGFGPRGGGPPFPMGPGMVPGGFGGLPPLPVAPHVNPAFFGRGMANGGMGNSGLGNGGMGNGGMGNGGMGNGGMGNGGMGNGGMGMEAQGGWEAAGWEDREYAGGFEGDEAERARAMMRERRRQERAREDWEAVGAVEKERRPPSRDVVRERRASDLDEELEDYGKRRRLATERNADR